MPDPHAEFTLAPPPRPVATFPQGTAPMPLQGLTVLAVEDSRFTCEALRQLCQRSGARLRRADTLRSARRHLQVYRPDVVLVDLGLPDGRGEDLIRDLARAAPRHPVILGTSGDSGGQAAALAAGAAGFLEKPVESLAAFQAAILSHLPGPQPVHHLAADPALTPDPLALRDDLAVAARLLAEPPDPGGQKYLAGFLTGLARSLHDPALERAARAVTAGSPTAQDRLAQLAGLMTRRIDRAPGPFAQPRA
jgi:CheY-like chemotaxis protein